MLQIDKVDSLKSESTSTFYRDLKEGEGFTLESCGLRIKLAKGHIFENDRNKLEVYSVDWPGDRKVIRVDVQIKWCTNNEK